MTKDEQIAAESNIRNAFGLFIEARRHLTIGEFQDAIGRQIVECGGHGFVASIGQAISAAVSNQQNAATLDVWTEGGKDIERGQD